MQQKKMALRLLSQSATHVATIRPRCVYASLGFLTQQSTRPLNRRTRKAIPSFGLGDFVQRTFQTIPAYSALARQVLDLDRNRYQILPHLAAFESESGRFNSPRRSRDLLFSHLKCC